MAKKSTIKGVVEFQKEKIENAKPGLKRELINELNHNIASFSLIIFVSTTFVRPTLHNKKCKN